MGADQQKWRQLVQDASANVKAARLLDADWPAGTLESADEALDAALAGQAPPAPRRLQGFGGTYSGHGMARDCYLGTDPEMGEWGQHWGHDVLVPAPGRIEAYSFPTPLNAPAGLDDERYIAQHAALFGLDREEPFVCYYGTQYMAIAVYWPDTPRRLSNGQTYRAAWFGHCRGDIAVGRVETGGRACTSWDSGINFERDGIPALASHVHCCGSATGTLSPNGDLDGFLIAQDFGWQVRNAGTVPGPDQYITGQYRAGKPLSAWAGRPPPPAPPS